jgi:hypothetical protein
VRDVREQRAQQHDPVDFQRVADLQDLLTECTPAHARLDAADQHHVPLRLWRGGGGEPCSRPLDVALVVDQGQDRAGDLQVVELFGLQGGHRFGLPRLFQVVQHGAGGVSSVVPPFERGDRHRRPQHR